MILNTDLIYSKKGRDHLQEWNEKLLICNVQHCILKMYSQIALYNTLEQSDFYLIPMTPHMKKLPTLLEPLYRWLIEYDGKLKNN